MKRSLLVLVLALSACSSLPTAEEGELFTIANRSSSTLVVMPFPGKLAGLVDLFPELEAAAFQNQQIAPGGARGIDSLPGYAAGDDLLLAIYVVQLGTRAYLTDYRLIAGVELLKSRRITLENIPSPRVALRN